MPAQMEVDEAAARLNMAGATFARFARLIFSVRMVSGSWRPQGSVRHAVARYGKEQGRRQENKGRE